jgi:prolycopene isomerase
MADLYDLSLSRRNFLAISGMALAAAAAGCSSGPALSPAQMAQRAAGRKDRPVVVIGAGLGGLTAAAYLAQNGVPVTLVESHSVPGGYATSFDRAGGRFTFEVSLHQSAAKSGSTLRALTELGLLPGLSLAAAPEFARIVTPELDIALPAADPAGCVEALARVFPAEREAIAAYVKELTQVPEETARIPEKMGAADYISFPGKFPLLWDLRKLSMAQFLDRHLKDPRLKDLLSVYWGYYGLPPSRLSAFYYAVATGDYMKHGGYYYLPRSQALSDALAETIQQAGGRAIYDNAVERIELAGGRVAGVVLAGGERIPAQAVLANANAPAVFGRMLPAGAVPADYLAKLSSYRASLSTFIVWLGLNQEIRSRVPGYSIGLSAGVDAEAEYQACLEGRADKVGLGVALYDNLAPNYSRPGTSTMTIMYVAGYEPWRRFEADYRAGRKDDYRREKDRVAREMVARVEKRLIPGLSGMIEVMEAATPLTNQRYTGNPQGAIYGFEQSLENAFMNRLDNRTPVKGLYLCSSWGNPGGGYTGAMMAGRDAYMKLMEDWAA